MERRESAKGHFPTSTSELADHSLASCLRYSSQETAQAAVAIVDKLADAGASAISLVGGLAEPLMPWLPARIRDLITEPQNDPLDGTIMARRAFFRLDSVRLRAG